MTKEYQQKKEEMTGQAYQNASGELVAIKKNYGTNAWLIARSRLRLQVEFKLQDMGLVVNVGTRGQDFIYRGDHKEYKDKVAFFKRESLNQDLGYIGFTNTELKFLNAIKSKNEPIKGISTKDMVNNSIKRMK